MREQLRHTLNMISELNEMGYELTNEQKAHAVIHSLPNGSVHIKMTLSRTKYIVTFEDTRWRIELVNEQREEIEVIGAEVHMSTSISRNGSKRKDQWI